MHAVVLDGFRDEPGREVLRMLSDVLAPAGVEHEVIALRDTAIAPCLGCFGCWMKTPGECVIDDAGRSVARSLAQADIVVYFTPITFGGVSSELKKALDRMIPNISPFFARVQGETHHQKRYARPPVLLGIGVLSHGDPKAEALFRALVEDNAVNLRSPRTATAVVALDEPHRVEAVLQDAIKAAMR